MESNTSTHSEEDRLLVDAARSQWAEGERKVHGKRGDTRVYGKLEDVIAAIEDEVRRRIGQTYSLLELARLYSGAESWCQPIAREVAPSTPAAWDLSLVQDAAFFRYARGARDYEP